MTELRKIAITLYYDDVHGEIAQEIVSDLLDQQEIESVHVGDPEPLVGATYDENTGTWALPDEPQARFPESINPERGILIVGDPVDGITLYGPFDNSEDAGSYAEQFHDADTWWIATPTAVQCDDQGNWIPNGT